MREYPVLDVHDSGRRHGRRNDRLHEEQRPAPGSPVDARAGEPKQQLGPELASVKKHTRRKKPPQVRAAFCHPSIWKYINLHNVLYKIKYGETHFHQFDM